MKELVNKILNGREKIEDVYFVACGGSLVDLYPGYYFVRTESKTMHADWITSKEFVVHLRHTLEKQVLYLSALMVEIQKRP